METADPLATPRVAGASVVLPVVVAGLTVAAVFRKGAFHPGDAAVVGLVSMMAVVACLVLRGTDRLALQVLGSLGALATWWMVSAAVHGTPERFLPLGASVLAFGAAFVAMRGLADPDRLTSAAGLVAIGAISSVVGLTAEAFRYFPLAEKAQNLWRVSTTLSYANAGGLFLAMALLVALALEHDRRLVRLAVCLCAAGLVATASRGAVLAFVLSACTVPWRQLRPAVRATAAGVAVGLVAVATSRGGGSQPIVIVAVVVASLVAVVVPPGRGQWHLDRRRVLVALGVLALAAVVAGVVLRVPIARRLNQDRLPEWSAAVHQWETAPMLGVGPDRPLTLDAATQTVATFAHSEYLQVLAGGGVVGEVLLVASGVAVATALSRRDPLAVAGSAAVIAFALAGAVDFVWHLPALALVAGWAAGLAARAPPPVPSRPVETG